MKQINLAALIIAFTISGISTVTASDTTSSITETDDWGGDDWEEEQSDLTVSHFVDVAYGSFIQDNQFTENNNSLSELRYNWMFLITGAKHLAAWKQMWLLTMQQIK